MYNIIEYFLLEWKTFYNVNKILERKETFFQRCLLFEKSPYGDNFTFSAYVNFLFFVNIVKVKKFFIFVFWEKFCIRSKYLVIHTENSGVDTQISLLVERNGVNQITYYWHSKTYNSKNIWDNETRFTQALKLVIILELLEYN